MRKSCVNIAGLICVLALTAPFAVPVAVAGSETTAQSEATAPPAKAEKPKMICKREPSTGSAIPKRVCRTQRQVDDEREAAKENINSLNDSQGGRSTGGPG